jgi:hypothetical protein
MSKVSYLSYILLVGALVLATAGVDCERHHDYRVYDPYYTDYHVWNDKEVGYYRQWSNENHRDASRDFRKLAPEEQKEYWTWRHNHSDRDRDRSRDTDHR